MKIHRSEFNQLVREAAQETLSPEQIKLVAQWLTEKPTSFTAFSWHNCPATQATLCTERGPYSTDIDRAAASYILDFADTFDDYLVSYAEQSGQEYAIPREEVKIIEDNEKLDTLPQPC